jgi:hypothetical protein
MSIRITEAELATLKGQLMPLVGTQFTSLSLPIAALEAFEPSQIGTIVGSLMDALLPRLPSIPQVGLLKHEGILGDREGYPDYKHSSGKGLELKLLYVDNPSVKMNKPPTPREPSARLTEKVTLKNVDPAHDAMLLIVYRIEPQKENFEAASPTIIDLDVFSIIELVEARDKRMTDGEGRWFGNYETPTILSKVGKAKVKKGVALDTTTYGIKESEGKDFNKDTNFGKLKRIPYGPLQALLTKHRVGTSTDEKEENLVEVLEELKEVDDQLQ